MKEGSDGVASYGTTEGALLFVLLFLFLALEFLSLVGYREGGKTDDDGGNDHKCDCNIWSHVIRIYRCYRNIDVEVFELVTKIQKKWISR